MQGVLLPQRAQQNTLKVNGWYMLSGLGNRDGVTLAKQSELCKAN